METGQESHKSACENVGPKWPSGMCLVPFGYPFGAGFSQMLSNTRKRVLRYRSGL